VREETVESDASETNDDAQIVEQTEFFVEPGSAVAQFFRCRLVTGWRATPYRRDPQVGQLHAVVARCRVRLRGESRFAEHWVEEVSRPVASEGASSAIGTMRAGSEAQRQHSRIGIAKRRNRLAPVRPIAIGTALHSGDFGAVSPKPFAALARHDAGVQNAEASRGKHNAILWDERTS